MYPVTHQIYGPILREKEGERSAARDLHAEAKRLMLPTWVALPLGAKENKELSLEGYVRREVGRVQSSWGSDVCLWDPRFLTFADDPSADGRILREVLEAFRTYGCKVLPVANLREPFPRWVAMIEHARKAGGGVAVRIAYDDLGELDLIDSLLASTATSAADVVLLVDLTGADMSLPDQFAEFLVETISRLRAHAAWANIIIAGSSFPAANPAKKNGQMVVRPRFEWSVWDLALKIDPGIRTAAMYGDFGADNAIFKFDGGGRPIPHLRYTGNAAWDIVRGGEHPSTVSGVARRIASGTGFYGRSFSAADEYIFDCAQGVIDPGDATRWRWANMNHHFMVVISTLAHRYGVELPARRSVTLEQLRLIAD